MLPEILFCGSTLQWLFVKGVDEMKTCIFCIAVGLCLVNYGQSYDLTNKGEQEKWFSPDTQISWITEDDGVYPNVYRTPANVTSVYKCSSAIEGGAIPACDNVEVRIVHANPAPVYVNSIDKLQAVIWTNNCDIAIPIGNPLPYYDASAGAVRTSVWEDVVEGLANCEKIEFGVAVIAAGYSRNYIYLKQYDINFNASVSISDFTFAAGLPKEADKSIVVRGNVVEQPESNISNVVVYVNVDRNAKDENLRDSWVVTQAVSSAGFECDILSGRDTFVDSGETFDLSLSVGYQSSLPAKGVLTNDYYRLQLTNTLSTLIQKRGSVWINEFDGSKVEICGTTNRYMTGNWYLTLTNETTWLTNRLDNICPFDFSMTMINDIVGIVMAECDQWTIPAESQEYVLTLHNGAGVIEHEAVVTLPVDAGTSYGFSGSAEWPEKGYAYDWSGTATNGTFIWCKDSATWGAVNESQSFNVFVKGRFRVQSLLEDSSDPLPSSALVELSFSGGSSNILCSTSGVDGYSDWIDFCGTHENITSVQATINANAFGWRSSPLITDFYFSTDNDDCQLYLSPSSAEENFNGAELSAYWANPLNKTWVVNNGLLYFDCYREMSGTLVELDTLNYLSSRGRKYVNLEFQLYNCENQYNYNYPDHVDFQLSSASDFSTNVIPLVATLSNKNPDYPLAQWMSYKTSTSLPNDITNWYFRIVGTAGGYSRAQLKIDNLRIAFQDMATVEGLRRTGTESNPSFEIDVKPWCGEGQSVSNVTAQLVMDVNGKVFTNDAVVAGTDVSITNLAEVTKFMVTPDIINANLEAGMGRPLRAHDKFKCWAQVNYFADSRDPDPSKEWETRYFPDNSKVDSEGRWTVEGVYGVDMNKVESDPMFTFAIPGDPISQNGDFGYDADNASTVDLGFRVHDEAGVSNVTVAISAGDSLSQSSTFVNDDYGVNDVDWFDVEISATNLLANTTYSVLVSGVNGNGSTLEGTSFTFTTLAAAATKAPVIEKVLNTVAVKADEDYDPMTDDGNPDDTEYAVRIRTGAGNDGIATTNNIEVWQTLEDWKVNPVTFGSPAIDLHSTNLFSFVTRNRENKVTGNDNPVETNCCFNMTAKFVGAGSQKANPFGNVQYTLEFTDPVQGEGEATAEMEYSIDGQDWLLCESYNFEFTDLAMTNSRAWDAWKAVGKRGTYDYRLRARVVSGARASEWAEISGTLDFVPPSNPEIVSDTEAGSVAGSKEFRFEANAADYDEEVTFHWTVNGSAEVAGTLVDDKMFAELPEGENTVSVYAADALGNKSEQITQTWIVDTIKPGRPAITDVLKNGAYTRNKAFEFAAKADDATALAYYWKLNSEEERQTDEFSGEVSKEGLHTVTVYAKDAAGNVSDIQTLSWTYDITPPRGLVIEGTPGSGAVMNNPSVSLKALVDKSEAEIAFTWNFNGNYISGAALDGTSKEGLNTATVTAVDKAGNVSSLAHSWTLDTIKPTDPVITGSPLAGTAVNSGKFSLTAASEDATTLKYHWTLNGRTATDASSAKFEGEAIEGVNTVAVYAEDEAGNASGTSTYAWTLDTVKPTVRLSSNTPNPFNASDDFIVNVTFSEPVTNFTSESVIVVNGKVGSVAGSGDGYTITVIPENVGEGSIEVQVCVPADVAADAAGNRNEESNVLAYECDTKRPEVTFASATPSVFNADRVSLVVTATFSEAVTGFAKASIAVENGTVESVQAVEGVENTYSIMVQPEKEGNVSIWMNENVVADAAGNGNAVSGKLVRTNDTTSPTAPAIEGMPESGASVNVKMFSFTAESEDENSLTYHWTLSKDASIIQEGIAGQTFEGRVEEDGAYTVTVYAEDAAGNASGQVMRTWVLDTVAPKVVMLESDAPARFNDSQMNVKVAFSEAVTNFTAASVLVDNGTVEDVQPVEGAENTYELTVTPAEKQGEDVVVAVKIPEGVVADAAGNGNSASARLSRTSDRTRPAVELRSNTVNHFNGELVVIAAFSESVKDVSASSVTVANGTVVDVELLADSDNAYQLTIKPAAEGEVSVSIEAGKVEDEAGNANESSNRLSFIYDTTPPPAPVITGMPANGESTTAKEFSFAAKAEDATRLTYIWKLTMDGAEIQNGVTSDGTVFAGTVIEDGLYTVTVYAKDAAGNESRKSSRMWNLDTVAPSVEFKNELPSHFNAESSPVEMIVVFSEPVTNFTATSVSVVNGTVGEPVKVDGAENANTYRFTVTPDADGEVSLCIPAGVVADAAGNINEVSRALTGVYDNTRPAVTISSDVPSRFNEEKSPMTVEVLFSEAVTGFSNTALTVDNGTVGAITPVENKENAYQMTIVPSKDGEVSVRMDADKVFDEAGNGNIESDSLKRMYDTTSPVVILESETPEPFSGNHVFTVKASFSEALSDFTVDMITVVNGTVDAEPIAVDGFENVYTFTISPEGDGEVSVQIRENKVEDLAGNGNVISEALTRTCDVTRPKVTFKGPEYFNDSSLTVVVSFSEPVTDFTEKSVTVDNGTLISVTGGGKDYR